MRAKFFTAVTKAAGALSVAALGLGALAGAAQAQIFQDNAIEYRFGTAFREPFNNTNITKSILNYTHVDGDKWGGNFISLDILMSSVDDLHSPGPTIGAQELYVVYRRDFSYNKLTGSKGGYGPIADFGLEVGADFNAKNDGFGSGKKLLVVGPYIAWAVPKGFLTTAFNACQEWNRDNNGPDNNSDFHWHMCFTAAWSFPFNVAGANMKFSGFFNVVTPKGEGTVTEILTRPEVTVDVGEHLFHRKNFVEVGFAYEYWLNKFGNDHNGPAGDGAFAKTPMFVGRVHF